MKTYSLLLVEDEQNILYGMKNVLSCTLDRLSKVMTAENGKEALELIKTDMPDMIITDIRMPEMDGLTLVQKLRDQGYRMPVIVLTAIADFETAKSLIPYGIQNYILKPFSVDDIIHETNSAIKKLDEEAEICRMKKLVNEHPELMETEKYTGKNNMILKAEQFIREHLKEGTTLSSLAEYLHVSKSYLATLFKQETNLTVTEFVTRERMREAKRLLLNTDMRICEIYQQIGYQSDKYFIAVFKGMEGITPLAYRKKYQV